MGICDVGIKLWNPLKQNLGSSARLSNFKKENSKCLLRNYDLLSKLLLSSTMTNSKIVYEIFYNHYNIMCEIYQDTLSRTAYLKYRIFVSKLCVYTHYFSH